MMVSIVAYQLPSMQYTMDQEMFPTTLYIYYTPLNFAIILVLGKYKIPSAAFQPFSLPSDFQMKNYRKEKLS